MIHSKSCNHRCCVRITVEDAKPPYDVWLPVEVLSKYSAFFQEIRKHVAYADANGYYGLFLKEHEHRILGDYLRWTTNGVLPLDRPTAVSLGNTAEEAEQVQNMYVRLSQAYILGVRFSDNTYFEAILKEIVWLKETRLYAPGPDCATTIYEGTREGDPARTFLTNVLIREAWDDEAWTKTWTRFLETYPHTLLADTVKYFIAQRDPRRFTADPLMLVDERTPPQSPRASTDGDGSSDEYDEDLISPNDWVLSSPQLRQGSWMLSKRTSLHIKET